MGGRANGQVPGFMCGLEARAILDPQDDVIFSRQLFTYLTSEVANFRSCGGVPTPAPAARRALHKGPLPFSRLFSIRQHWGGSKLEPPHASTRPLDRCASLHPIRRVVDLGGCPNHDNHFYRKYWPCTCSLIRSSGDGCPAAWNWFCTCILISDP